MLLFAGMAPDRSTGVAPVAKHQARYLPLLSLVIGAVALVRIWQFFAEVPIGAPYQFDYEEGNILNALLRITQGSTPYPDPHALPNVINPYGPLAYYLLVLPVKVLGLAFVYPRVVIMGCALAVSLLLGFELHRRTRSAVLAVSFSLLLLSIPNIQEWAWLLRVDLLGIGFTFAGFFVFVRRLERQRDVTLLPGILFALALLVKPTFFAAPAACFFALIVRRRYPEAVRLTAVTAIVFALVMAIFAVVTRGAVLIDVFLSHPDPFSFRVYEQGLLANLRISLPLFLLALIALACDVARRRYSPAVWWLIFSTMTAITAGKLGSNQNHFLEWNVALCLSAGLGMDALFRISNARAALVTSAAAVATTVFVISFQPAVLDNVNPERGCVQAYQWVRTQAGPNLLSENVGALVLGQKKVWVSNPFVLAQLVEHAGWSDAELVRMVRERRFDAILMRSDYPSSPSLQGIIRFSPALLRAIGENYAPEPKFQCLDMSTVFRPLTP